MKALMFLMSSGVMVHRIFLCFRDCLIHIMSCIIIISHAVGSSGVVIGAAVVATKAGLILTCLFLAILLMGL